MSVIIHIPTALRRFTTNSATISVEAENIEDAFNDAIEQHPQLKAQLFADNGQMRRFINVFLNDQDIRYLEQHNTTLAPGDNLTVVPAIAGG
jgi:molybdopterin converting factor small subunit